MRGLHGSATHAYFGAAGSKPAHVRIFDVRFPDDSPSKYFYWDDVPITREQALEQAKGIAS